MANPSLVVTADHRIKLEEAKIQEPGPGQALVHIRATGLCGSDVHFWRHGRIGSLTVDGDCILGHEAAGVVLKLGPDVTNLAVGDRVAVEPGVPCGVCFLCAAGRYNLCEAVSFVGVYPHHGTIQRYKVHPARYLHKIPKDFSFDSAAMLEPLSVALHALRTTPIHVGTPVAIFGAGPIGLLTMAAARASGAHPVILTDVQESRLQSAKEFEPNCITYQVDLSDTPEQTAKKIRTAFEATENAEHTESHTEYDMPALVLDCTGIESSIITAAYTVRRGGSINVVGVSSKPLLDNVPFMHLSLAEISLRFINRYHDTWPAAIRALSGGLIDSNKVDSLITHKFKLEEAVEALELVAGSGKSGAQEMVIKVQIVDAVENAVEC